MYLLYAIDLSSDIQVTHKKVLQKKVLQKPQSRLEKARRTKTG